MEENKQNIKDNGSLNYKNQDPFFIDYYFYRRKALESKQKILLGERQNFLLDITTFLDFSVDYIYNYESKNEIIEQLLKDYKNMDASDFRTKVNALWKSISADHVKFAILPKPEIEEQDEELNNLDDKTRSALEAWKLVYAQK